MRKPGKWMKMPDTFVLEYIEENGPTSPMKLVSEDGGNLPFSRGYVNVRCQSLEEHGFVQNIGNGLYQITDRGEEWLAGEYDASVLDPGNTAHATA